MEFDVPTWSQIYDMLMDEAREIEAENFHPDVVVGVVRGGLIPARILVDLLEAPQFGTMQIEHYLGIGAASDMPTLKQPNSVPVMGKKVLVVDDIVDTGKSLCLAIAHLKQQGAKQTKTATLYYKPYSVLVPDFYEQQTRSWVVFPWETKETLRKLQQQNGGKRALGQEIAKLVKAGFPKQLAEKLLVDIGKEPNNAVPP
ncbi:MAG TPA: phosphoribosyltransferase family protein [Candidatus Deferrimicrobiaceae bacterium]|nr:phosphoribosyltransferase family protein [Candidatus Deferrimicrobiaceae bacterium]